MTSFLRCWYMNMDKTQWVQTTKLSGINNPRKPVGSSRSVHLMKSCLPLYLYITYIANDPQITLVSYFHLQYNISLFSPARVALCTWGTRYKLHCSRNNVSLGIIIEFEWFSRVDIDDLPLHLAKRPWSGLVLIPEMTSLTDWHLDRTSLDGAV